MDRPRLLVILGMNLTALAVARSARRWRVEPWVVDVEPGPAAHSRIARCMLDRSRSRAALLQKIIAEVADRRAWLVSTSDAWNHELLAHREAVDRAFANVLQPSNDALAFFKFKGPGSREADEACANCGYYEIAHDSAKLDGRPSVIDTGKCSGFVAHGPFDRDEFYDGCMGWD